MEQKQRNNLVGYAIIIALASLLLFNMSRPGKDTRISVSENKKQISIAAEFPHEKSDRVHSFLRKKLNLADLPDLDHLEIKHYSTADRFSDIYVKSRTGYLKLVLDKRKN